MKYIYLFLKFFILFAILSGCSNPEDSNELKINTKVSASDRLGTLKGSDYKNNYFKFSITKPDAWIAQDDKARAKIMKLGAELIAGDDDKMKAALAASKIRNLSLFSFSKYPLGTPGKVNPNVMGIAENISMVPSIKTSNDYLMNVKKILTISRLKYSVDNKTETKMVSGVKFVKMNVSTTINGIKVLQEYLVTLKHGYAFSIILTYTDSGSKKITENILGTVKFNQ